MSADLSRCYELLGVKPGVSIPELKAAHRDLAKVWHPDRFGHDPRLQQKAQEKLKEINEAFELLISGKTPRAPVTHSADFDSSRQYPSTSRPASRKTSVSMHWIIIPLLLFGAVFFFTTRSLLQRRTQRAQEPETQTTALQRDAALPSENPSKPSASDVMRNKSRGDAGANESPESQTPSAEVRTVATVTVVVDPTNGLLAKPDCPNKTRMSYPSGNEPHAYCTITHTRTEVFSDPLPAKESRIKTIARRVTSPGKWIGSDGSKERSEGETKPNQ